MSGIESDVGTLLREKGHSKFAISSRGAVEIFTPLLLSKRIYSQKNIEQSAFLAKIQSAFFLSITVCGLAALPLT
jgi:hypothetical protein